jgi:hypothetical protein
MKDRSTMSYRKPKILPFWVVTWSLLFPASFAHADGGTLRVCNRSDHYQVAVFTSPTPLRAGPVDLSVLVQRALNGECVTDARAFVRLKSRGSGRVMQLPATADAATNKLFRAATFELPEPGWWDVEVAVEGPYGPTLVTFDFWAEEPLPRWVELWPWFGWPALVVVLFGLHQASAHLPRRLGGPWSRKA